MLHYVYKTKHTKLKTKEDLWQELTGSIKTGYSECFSDMKNIRGIYWNYLMH